MKVQIHLPLAEYETLGETLDVPFADIEVHSGLLHKSARVVGATNLSIFVRDEEAPPGPVIRLHIAAPDEGYESK